MTNRQIDISNIPVQKWSIGSQAFLQLAPASPAFNQPVPPPTSSLRAFDSQVLARVPSLEIQLFDNAAELKIALSEIVMHLEPEWRTVIFSQIDKLLDLNNWQEDSSFIQRSTFMTFLRFIIFAAPTRLPSLGVGATGNLLAAWLNGNQRITIEFLADDKAVATFVKQGTRSKEMVVWRGHIADLKLFIERFDMIECIKTSAA